MHPGFVLAGISALGPASATQRFCLLSPSPPPYVAQTAFAFAAPLLPTPSSNGLQYLGGGVGEALHAGLSPRILEGDSRTCPLVLIDVPDTAVSG